MSRTLGMKSSVRPLERRSEPVPPIQTYSAQMRPPWSVNVVRKCRVMDWSSKLVMCSSVVNTKLFWPDAMSAAAQDAGAAEFMSEVVHTSAGNAAKMHGKAGGCKQARVP